jgi:hypothetical protein
MADRRLARFDARWKAGKRVGRGVLAGFVWKAMHGRDSAATKAHGSIKAN